MIPYRWNYDKGTAFRYGADDLAYRMAMDYLGEVPGVVEDWGCGAAYARSFLQRPDRYRGIDAWPAAADHLADLASYWSSADGILLRGVLEHNPSPAWDLILENAVRSYRYRMVLAIFTPFSATGKTELLRINNNSAPDLSFVKEEIIKRCDGLVREERITNGTEYRQETLFFLERRA